VSVITPKASSLPGTRPVTERGSWLLAILMNAHVTSSGMLGLATHGFSPSCSNTNWYWFVRALGTVLEVEVEVILLPTVCHQCKA
jgi:hypothetical protein